MDAPVLLERVFQPHVQFCKQPFGDYTEDDFAALERELAKLKLQLETAVGKTR